jgi:hypothetical protein
MECDFSNHIFHMVFNASYEDIKSIFKDLGEKNSETLGTTRGDFKTTQDQLEYLSASRRFK